MKLALTLDGRPVKAAVSAPKQAVCPCCGGELTLRSRRLMGNGKRTYFWRHRRNQNRHCSARHRPMG